MNSANFITLSFVALLSSAALSAQEPTPAQPAETVVDSLAAAKEDSLIVNEYVVFGNDTIPNRVIQQYNNPDGGKYRSRQVGNVWVCGSQYETRVYEPFYPGKTMAKPYADVVNYYKSLLGPEVNIYCMVIPTQCEFYQTNDVKAITRSECDYINYMYECLDSTVVAVDAYTILSQHTDEHLYLRTDHHWSPLGAYYAAYKFAAVAKVPFKDLSHYEKKVIHRFVGSMYWFTKDATIKQYPEDFVYYIPTEVEYKTIYIDYTLNGQTVVGASQPHEGTFFKKFGDGSSAAYCTFMGGDSHLTHVQTSAGTGRKLLIFKESYGNAIPGYLFYSFDDIFVVDCRYFTKNVLKYIKDNGITDVLFANNASHSASKRVVSNYRKYLTQ